MAVFDAQVLGDMVHCNDPVLGEPVACSLRGHAGLSAR